MNTNESVTFWFHAIKDGKKGAATGIWNRYFDRIVGVAKKRLYLDPSFDGEDLAASVLATLYDIAKGDKSEQLANRDELWALLLVLTQRKVADRNRRSQAAKRTPKGKRTELGEIPSDLSPPDLAVSAQEECRHLLGILADPQLQELALRRLDGQTVEEIARELNIGPRTVTRRLASIRKKWEERLNVDSDP